MSPKKLSVRNWTENSSFTLFEKVKSQGILYSVNCFSFHTNTQWSLVVDNILSHSRFPNRIRIEGSQVYKKYKIKYFNISFWPVIFLLLGLIKLQFRGRTNVFCREFFFFFCRLTNCNMFPVTSFQPKFMFLYFIFYTIFV